MITKNTLAEPVPLYRYIAHFEYDEEYRTYTVTVPALPGCVTQGRTLDEARFMVQDAVEGYLESLKMDGIEPPAEDAPALSQGMQEVVEVSVS